MPLPELEELKARLPIVSVVSIIASLIYGVITSNMYATKAEMVNMIEVARTERATLSVNKEDYKSDITEIKVMVSQLYSKIEEIRVDNARGRR